MKQLFQIIALNLFGLSALQLIAAAGIAVMLLQMAINKFLATKWIRTWQEKREIERHLWQIE